MKYRLFVYLLIICGMLFSRGMDDFSYLLMPHTGSARINSMGGLNSTTTGAEALLSSPGGIAFSENFELITSGYVHLLGRYDFEKDFYDAPDTSYKSRYAVYGKLTNLVFSKKIFVDNNNIDLAFALGYRSYLDCSHRYLYRAKYLDSTNETISTNKGGLNVLTPGMGIAYDGKWAIGVTYNYPLVFNRYVNQREYTQDTPEEYYTYKVIDEYEVSGSFFEFGFQARPIPELTLGVGIRSPIELDFENGISTTETSTGATEDSLSDYEIFIPTYVNYGALIQVSKGLAIGVEYQSRPWEDVKINKTLSGIGNGTSLRFGLEAFPNDNIAIRAGYLMEKHAIKNADGELITDNIITSGIGIIKPNLNLDFGFNYLFNRYNSGGKYDITHGLLTMNIGFAVYLF